jgi:hypothetical protein
MKRTKITYWTFTVLICLLDGLVPALFGNGDAAKQGITHLGYPDYFRVLLTFFKVTGAIVLIVPYFKRKIKEWAYAGFTFSLVSAFLSIVVVDGFGATALGPVIAFALLAGSYFSYQKLLKGAEGRANKSVSQGLQGNYEIQ